MTAQHPHPLPRKDWLSLTQEEPLLPDQPIIDAHHHLWRKSHDPYTAREVLKDAGAGHRIVATVFVEGETGYRSDGPDALKPVGETELAAAEAGTHGSATDVARGIVSYADLMLGDRVDEVLDAHTDAGQGRFRGIRYSVPWHADPAARGSTRVRPAGQLYDPMVRAGLSAVQKRGLVYDAWAYHTQLNDIFDLARAMPDLAIIMDHAGGPIGIGPYAGRRDEVFVDWKHAISRLATCPNVCIKLGGLGMRLNGFGFDGWEKPPGSQQLADAWGPYLEACIDAFGTDRAMFETNFPVDKGAAPAGIVWNCFKRITLHASEEERNALFYQTANRIYTLGLPDPSAVCAGSKKV
ncbi:amidohydrolase [Puniceibacterium sp. IMCC21224]|uniref:amidohydrolase family protein n=1 Tax=Puniceibacterium sp. IMCC21224 TaxID=1618204 RepID=UPI00064DE75E|nr:amidohydrolase family protein [Puniceibacterium sp. IMCC21224]KMK64926.1 putative TIM-barrel fold metal-dependent hydrolase [Puniceibacterium sp. IMCC21224]